MPACSSLQGWWVVVVVGVVVVVVVVVVVGVVVGVVVVGWRCGLEAHPRGLVVTISLENLA